VCCCTAASPERRARRSPSSCTADRGAHRSLLALDGLSDTHRVLFYNQRGAGLPERVTKDRLGLANPLGP